MKFNENEFRQLVAETEETVIRLGTTSHTVFDRHKRFTEMLVEHLKTLDRPFELEPCLDWANSLNHDTAKAMSESYVEWIALHRFIHLLAEQKAGTLNHWHHYLSHKLAMPQSSAFLNALTAFNGFLTEDGLKHKTVKSYSSYARRLLLFLESRGTQLSDIKNQDIIDYFMTDRFKNRKLKGIQTEICCLKKFLTFLADNRYVSCQTLHCALPRIRHTEEKIISTIDEAIEKDLLEDEPESLVNKRDQAILLLALHTGLRTCDIRSLRFSDIDWQREIIHIRQSKTEVDLEIPVDSETQNAIIDYILNERRECDQDYVFVTAVGPAQKLERGHYRMKYRVKGTDSFERLPHDGLHIYRRTFASRLLQSGAALPAISEMLGHIDKNSVRVYLSTDEMKMKRCALDLSLIPCRREEY